MKQTMKIKEIRQENIQKISAKLNKIKKNKHNSLEY